MTPEEIRAWVDGVTSRTHPDGTINAGHVALEETLRERYGHPSYVAALDGPERFRLPPAVRLQVADSYNRIVRVTNEVFDLLDRAIEGLRRAELSRIHAAYRRRHR